MVGEMVDTKYRKTIRLKNYNYNNNGFYFITILAHKRSNLFGNIVNSKVEFNQLGELVNNHWHEISNHFDNVTLDQFIVMPNHIHGLILVENAFAESSEMNRFQKVTSKSLSSIVQNYKASVSREHNRQGVSKKIWQSNYYERVIRTEKELEKCREYIMNNPLKWQLDRNNLRSDKLKEEGSIY